MTRKIDEKLARSFVNRMPRMAGNTAVIVTMQSWRAEVAVGYVPTVVEMVLHGNKIASWCPEYGSFYTTLAGFCTVTTKARLNALINEMVDIIPPICNWYCQKKGRVYWGITQRIEDLRSLQWHARPPVGKAHPGFDPFFPEQLEGPALKPSYKPSYEKNMEVLL